MKKKTPKAKVAKRKSARAPRENMENEVARTESRTYRINERLDDLERRVRSLEVGHDTEEDGPTILEPR